MARIIPQSGVEGIERSRLNVSVVSIVYRCVYRCVYYLVSASRDESPPT